MSRKMLFIMPLLLTIVLCPPEAAAKIVTFGIEGGYFAPGSSIFKEVYGSGGLCYGVNGAFFLAKSVSIQAGFNMYHRDGTITGSDQSTTINLGTLRLGVFYHFDMKKLMPKIGAGAVYVWGKEENVFGEFSGSSTGFFAGTGVDYRLAGAFLVGAELLYHNAKVKGAFDDESIGGISLLLSLKVEI